MDARREFISHYGFRQSNTGAGERGNGRRRNFETLGASNADSPQIQEPKRSAGFQHEISGSKQVHGIARRARGRDEALSREGRRIRKTEEGRSATPARMGRRTTA